MVVLRGWSGAILREDSPAPYLASAGGQAITHLHWEKQQCSPPPLVVGRGVEQLSLAEARMHM